jgi:superfamily II DNA or RNA helicase
VFTIGCGAGKSIIAGTIAKAATDKGNRVLFLVHRAELCEQISDTFYGLCNVNAELCDIMMIQTARRRLSKIQKPVLIIVDEAHVFNQAYEKVFEYFSDSFKIGFTATPCRLNQGGLGNLFEDLLTSVSTRWLIDNKYLSEYRYYSFPLIDTSKLHTRAGEFVQEEVEKLLDNTAVFSGTVNQYQKITPGKKAMIYCGSIKASKEIVEEFNRNGITAAHVDGTMSKKERERIVSEYRQGKITVVSNVDLFGVGFDDKDIEVTILLRPTQSLALAVQQNMRCMRYKEGKTAIILDCCGNVVRHGLPDDNREWTLEPKAKQENIVKIRECHECFAVYPPALEKCPYCGAVAVKEIQRKDKKVVDIDLVEMKRQDDIRSTRLADAQLETWAEVVEFQKLHKYKFAWCIRYAVAHGIPIPAKYNYMRRIIGI